jgi:hypothetical protein
LLFDGHLDPLARASECLQLSTDGFERLFRQRTGLNNVREKLGYGPDETKQLLLLLSSLIQHLVDILI